MLITIVLIIVGLIQLITSFLMFFSNRQTGNSIYGVNTHIENLNSNQSIFRYMLCALWFSVSVVYFVGAFNSKFTSGASLLAALNMTLEVIGYWAGHAPKWVSVGGTIVFGLFSIICLFYI